MSRLDTRRTGPTVPWSFSDAKAAFFLAAAGAGLLMWAWWESGGTGRVSHQTAWTVVGELAVVAIALGSVVWVASGRRAVRHRRNELVSRLDELVTRAHPEDIAKPTAGDGFVFLAGSGRYHREGCQLVQGKPAQPLALGPSARNGLRPCEMCEP